MFRNDLQRGGAVELLALGMAAPSSSGECRLVIYEALPGWVVPFYPMMAL